MGEAKLRILVLSQHYWPENFRINAFVDELREAGAEVAVLTGQPNYPKGVTFDGYRWHDSGVERHPNGYDIVRVPLVPRGTGGYVGMVLNYLSFIGAGMLLAPRLLKDRRFDIIFVYGTSPIFQGFVGAFLKPRVGGKLVLWVQDLWPHALAATGFFRNRRILAGVEALVKSLYRRADLILAQSDGFASVIHGQISGPPIEVFPNPGEIVDPSLLDMPAADASTFDVVFAGNLGRAQALDTVIDAAALLDDLPDVRILLYGSGAMEDWLRKQIAERGLDNVQLCGRSPAADMPAIFSRASAALLTLVDDEMIGLTIPSKLQSYLASGVPVIAAAGPDARRIVEQAGAGVACPPENPAALADAIRRLHGLSLADRNAMRSAGRAFHDQHFDPRLLARRLMRRLEDLRDARQGDG